MENGPLILAILDGFGDYQSQSQSCQIDSNFNAIYQAKTPTWDYLYKNYPKTQLKCSGKDVGLPDNQMGNSEVGHMNIGTGRIVYQDFTKINQEIKNGDFYNNAAINNLVKKTESNKKNIHILNLLSDGGIHSHLNHLFATLELISKKKFKNNIYLHLILDGRDTPPKSASIYINKLNEEIKKYSNVQIKTICGRFYAMDRDNRWDRIEKAYNLITLGISEFHYENIETAINNLYNKSNSDEFIPPISIGEKNTLENLDSIIFTNFRADRARQISQAFLELENNFNYFKRKKINFSDFVTFTQYSDNLKANVAFEPNKLTNSLGEVLAKNNISQLRIAETEKYAHVTFFFSGGKEKAFLNETRILIPSPKVSTYDLKPEMSLPEITNKICEFIKTKKFDVIITNFANPDMVGHTGDMNAAIQAIESVDDALGKIYDSIKKHGGELLITADHGNAEIMYDTKTKQPHTAHTTSLVPFVYVGRKAEVKNITNKKLSDIAPTALYLLGLDKPHEMTGNVLFNLLNN